MLKWKMWLSHKKWVGGADDFLKYSIWPGGTKKGSKSVLYHEQRTNNGSVTYNAAVGTGLIAVPTTTWDIDSNFPTNIHT